MRFFVTLLTLAVFFGYGEGLDPAYCSQDASSNVMKTATGPTGLLELEQQGKITVRALRAWGRLPDKYIQLGQKLREEAGLDLLSADLDQIRAWIKKAKENDTILAKMQDGLAELAVFMEQGDYLEWTVVTDETQLPAGALVRRNGQRSVHGSGQPAASSSQLVAAPQADTKPAAPDTPGKENTLLLYQKVYRPGQTLLCKVLPREPGSVWLVLRPEGDKGQDVKKDEEMPVLYPAQSLDHILTIKLPQTPGDYSLSVYDGNGRFLTEGKVAILPAPVWEGELKGETEGYPGLGGIPVEPGTEITYVVHNKPEWVKGGNNKKFWVGLYQKEDPQTGKRPINYWYIRQKQQFSQIKTIIKEPGEYQFRLIDEQGKDQELLLTTDIMVGELLPVQRFADADQDRPSLLFTARQKIRIANTGLGFDRIRNLDPHCLVVPSWFTPADIQHGLNHALAVNTDMKRGDGAQIELPEAGGEYDILYAPHWLALHEDPPLARLARIRVEETVTAALTLPQTAVPPGGNIRFAARFGSSAQNLGLYLLAEENMQVRADKARSVSEKRHTVFLNTKNCPEGWCWSDMTAPLRRGKYILAAYNDRQLVAVRPVSVEKRLQPGPEIVLSQGVYLAGQPFRFKVFPPAEGMAKAGRVGLFKEDKEVSGTTLSPQAMDYPVTLQAPKESGAYELRFFLAGGAKDQQATVLAQVEVAFIDGATMAKSDSAADQSGFSPEVLALFSQTTPLSGSSLARFTLFNNEVAVGQEVLINYSVPNRLPACVVVVPRGMQPTSLAQAMKGAIKVQELSSAEDLLNLKILQSGEWDLCFYDTLRWAKAGPPSLITTLPLKVRQEGPTPRLEIPETVFAKGDVVLRLVTSPEQELAKEERSVRLYPEIVNTIRNNSATLATASFEPVFHGIYQAKLALDLQPGRYQLTVGNNQTIHTVQVVANPSLLQETAVRHLEKELMPLGMVTAQFSPAAQWQKGWAWALAVKEASGTYRFVDPPRVTKEQADRVVRTAFTLPRTPGEYQLCLWENDGTRDYAKLPATVVTLPINLKLPQAYVQQHLPEVELRAYFALDDTLYAGMFTTGTFTASIDYDRSAWIGLLPASPPAKELTSEAARKSAFWSTGLNGKDRGEMSFLAPEKSGAYQLVMYDGGKNGQLVLQRAINLLAADMAMLEKQAEMEADAWLETLPEYEEDVEAIKQSIRESYKEQLEVPTLRSIPVSSEMLQQLQGSVPNLSPAHLAGTIADLLAPASACAAATTRDCEADIDLAIENMRKVNINFGDGVNVRQVVGELATKMASDLVLGEKHIAQAKKYYDQSKGYYEQAMKLKGGVEKNGWQETVEGALWDSTQAMFNSCVTDGCLSKLGRKAIEHKLKGYNPTKMSKEEQEAWKKEYTRMVVLLDPGDLRALETQTAQFADLAGQLSVPDAGTKAKEMAKEAAINTMKTVTMSMVSKVPGWAALKAYYETLNVLRGALIDHETVEFMDEYRKLRNEGSTISQVHDVLAGKQVNYLMTSLRERMESNPAGYKKYLSEANQRLLLNGHPIKLSAGEIDSVIMGHMEQWYQQEVQDTRKEKMYQEMKNAWYASDCKFEAYKAEVAKKDFFGTMSELGGHITSSVSGALGGQKTSSSMTCARKAVAFQNFLNLRGQILQQMAGWQGGKDQACRLGTPQNNRLLDKLTCEAVLNPAIYKQTMAANAEVCGALPKPLPPTANPKVKELSKKSAHAIAVLLKASGNEDILKCLCGRHSVMGNSCSYHPQPTKNFSPSCDNPGPPCIQGNWGCFRKEPAMDQASLEGCGVAKAIREFRSKDNAKYQKWLQLRKKYLEQ